MLLKIEFCLIHTSHYNIHYTQIHKHNLHTKNEVPFILIYRIYNYVDYILILGYTEVVSAI